MIWRFKIEKGRMGNLDEVAEFYEEVAGFLEKGVNYPGRKKDVYPIREDAKNGLLDQTLFAARDDRIAGSVILNREQEEGYKKVKWIVGAHDSKVPVVHTLAVGGILYCHGASW